MKIRYRILLLLAIPLICQLTTVGLLASSFATVDKNVDREIIAKRIVTLVEEINGLVSREMVEVTGTHLLMRQKNDLSRAGLRKSLEEKIAELGQLVKSDKMAETTFNRFATNTRRFMDNWSVFWSEDILAITDLSQFTSRGEFAESMKVLYQELLGDSAHLTEMYGPMAKELQPQAIQQRELVRKFILITICGNVLLVVAMAVITNRNTLARLGVLMRNIERFSKGRGNLETLEGMDELAELDRAFRDMSFERNRLEGVKQAMRAMVSHDIKTPLTSIALRLELLAKQYQSDTAIFQQLNLVHSEARRLQRLASTLLDVEKMDEGLLDLSLSEHQCDQIVTNAVMSVEAMAHSKGIRIIQNVERQSVRCDNERIIQVIVNLLSNAIKFSPRESSIEINVTAGPAGGMRCELLDEGPGIPPGKIDGLFSKFHQLEQPAELKKEGSGLGLYICKMLVQSHSGRIGCANRHSGGSCFWFELPELPGNAEDGVAH